MIKNIYLDVSKKYDLPQMHDVRYKNKILLISKESSDYLVLDNETQLNFYRLLESMTIQDALNSCEDIEMSKCVLTQIEAKKIYIRNNIGVKHDHMQIFLTNECNLRCPHCYMSAGIKKGNELSQAEIKELLINFVEHGGKSVTYTGGEICMRNDLVDIISDTYKLGLTIDLYTNGVLWTSDLVEKVASLINSVQISIDGYDEESNSKVRSNGNFNKALSCVDLFINNGVHVDVAVTPFFDDRLFLDYKKYANFGKSLLRRYKNKLRVVFSGDYLDGRDVKLTDSQKQKYREVIENIYIECYGTPSDMPFIEMQKEKKLMDNCAFGSINVSATGDVYLCARTPFLPSIANIRKSSYDEIFGIAIKAQRNSKVTNLQPCSDCELKFICGGGCRIDNFPILTNQTCFDTLESTKFIRERICTENHKRKFYDLMIRANSFIYQ